MEEVIGSASKIISNFGVVAGLLIILILALCFISYQIIMHIINQNKETLTLAIAMNEKWHKVIEDHSANAKEFHALVNQAHEYQRREHEKMIANLEEQGKVLVRINGFKHE